MNLSLRKQSISLKSLVLILLLSFIGQAWALPAICTMSETEVSSASPCHDMMMAAGSVILESSDITSADIESAEMNMDCCDPVAMTDSSCSCPDNGCSASLSFASQAFTDSFSYNGQVNYYSQSGFPNQINSALFRPPIV